MGRIKKAVKDTEQTSDALVATETVYRKYKQQLSELIQSFEEEWSLTEKQAVELLQEVLKKSSTGDFVPKHLSKKSNKE